MAFGIKLQRINYFFFCFVLLELFLCGSGQVIKIGPITLRMINFTIALLYIFVGSNKMNRQLNLYLFIYSLYIVFWFSYSIIFNDYKFVFEDIKPLSYFFLFPFIHYMVIKHNTIDTIISLLRISTLTMAVIYIIYILLVKNDIINYSLFYAFASEHLSDIMFRGSEGELFYKGFVYLPIGFIIFFDEKKYFKSIILLIAIYLTQTRGFYIITIVGLIIHYYTTHTTTIKKIFIVPFFIITIIYLIIISGLFDMGVARSEGDEERMITLYQVAERITLLSSVIGHGFGYGVPIREIHMEMSYLEILHKQGIVGIILWICLYIKIYLFWKNSKKENKRVSNIFFIGLTILYVQSLFNPYINNPMGIGFILLAYYSCYKLSYYYEDSMCNSAVQSKIV